MFSNELVSVHVLTDGFELNTMNLHTPFDKWAAIEVKDFGTIPDDMQTYTLPAGLYAVVRHIGAASEGAKTFNYIFNTWFPNSTYKHDSARPHFEILGDRYKNEDALSEEDIYIPIISN